MTQAVCIHCGSMKLGAVNSCNSCGFQPSSDDEIIRSVAMSDHYFKIDILENMGQIIRSGQEVTIEEDFYRKLQAGLRKLQGKPTLGNEKKSFWSRLFGGSKNKETITDKKSSTKQTSNQNIEWVFVAERFSGDVIQLIGRKRIVEIEDVVFGLVLVTAKINGWQGGNEFFDIIGKKGILREIKNNMSVDEEYAVELGIKYYDFIKKNTDGEGNRGDLDEDFLRICAEGGFHIKK